MKLLLVRSPRGSGKTMRHSYKRILQVMSVALGVGLAWFSWQLWMINVYFSGVHWTTEDGGLEIDYMPGKPHLVNLRLNDTFTPYARRIWVKDFPSATDHWIGRVDVPDPEELFERAHINVGSSDTIAVCRYYPFATEIQKLNIDDRIEWMHEQGTLTAKMRECFDRVRPYKLGSSGD